MKEYDEKTINNALKIIDRLLLLLSILSSIIFFLLYYFADNIFKYLEQSTITLIKSLMVGFLSVVFPFVISYFVLKKVQELKASQTKIDLVNDISSTILPKLKNYLIKPEQNYELIEFDKIKWEELLSEAKNVDIFVHYFDTWLRNNCDLIKGIFYRDGNINIIIPCIKNNTIIKIIKQRFPEYTEKQIKQKIYGTSEKIYEYKKNINKGLLNIYETNELGYYCGIKIDEKYFIYSSYEHIRNDRKILGPTFIIRIDKEQSIGKWFDKEFNNIPKKIVNMGQSY